MFLRKAEFANAIGLVGKESVAIRIGLSQPDAALSLLQETMQKLVPASGEHTRMKLIEAELHLALGKQPRAITCFLEVQSCIGSLLELLGTPYVPFPTELSDTIFEPDEVLQENWLIYRFVTLKSYVAALDEYKRLWDLQLHKLQKYIVRSIDPHTNRPLFYEVQPFGFDSEGLQFTLSYARFLEARSRRIESLQVLLQPLLVMDLDRNPNVYITALASDDPRASVRKALLFDRTFPRIRRARMSRSEYIRTVANEFEKAAQLPLLLKGLYDAVPRRNQIRRVLAQVIWNLGEDVDEALELESQYLNCSTFDELSKSYRRATVLEHTGAHVEAFTVYQAALNNISAHPDTADGIALSLPDADESSSTVSLTNSTSSSNSAGTSPPTASASIPSVNTIGTVHKPKHILVEEIVRKIVTLLSETNCCGAETNNQIANTLRWQFETHPKLYDNWNTWLYCAAWHQRHQLEDSFIQWAYAQFNNVALNQALSWRGRLHILLVLNDHPALQTYLLSAVQANHILPTDFELWKGLVLRTPAIHRNAQGVTFTRSDFSSERQKVVDRLLMELLERYPDDRLLAEHRAHQLHTEDQGFVVLPHN